MRRCWFLVLICCCVYEINALGVFITTSKRESDTFYLTKVLRKLPVTTSTKVLVYNTEKKSSDHKAMYRWYDRYAVSKRFAKFKVLNWPSLPFAHARESRFAHVHEMANEAYNIAARDSFGRKRWRTKECLDFVDVARYAMYVEFPHERTFLFLEDDQVYFLRRRNSITLPTGVDMVFMGHSKSSAVLFRRDVLELLVGYLSTRCTLSPLDWLIRDFVDKHDHRFLNVKTGVVFEHVGKKTTKFNFVS